MLPQKGGTQEEHKKRRNRQESKGKRQEAGGMLTFDLEPSTPVPTPLAPSEKTREIREASETRGTREIARETTSRLPLLDLAKGIGSVLIEH
jgi:hypothetical protein